MRLMGSGQKKAFDILISTGKYHQFNGIMEWSEAVCMDGTSAGE